jgi:tRNA U34 2-thiouridine synthase MnmA/TrmU
MTSRVETARPRAVILLSGGLDSTLAARMLVDQGVELHAIHFTSPFCTCSRGGEAHAGGCRSQAQVVAGELGIPIRTIVKGQDYVDVIRRPSHGRGSGMNPCIDCRIYTLRKSKEFMESIGATFLVTGEVLGQRPMSQREDAIRFIERHAGCEDIVLRPLSAQHFPPTLPEREGLVDRDKLMGITGRSRKEQIALAHDLGVVDYPCPAGGCLLTDKTFSIKVRDLFAHSDDVTMADLNLLKVGRHFRMADGRKVIVSQNEDANRRLEALCAPMAGRTPFPTVFRSEGIPGPSAAIFGTADEPLPMRLLSKIYSRYTKPGAEAPFHVVRVSPGEAADLSVPRDDDFDEVQDAMLCK